MESRTSAKPILAVVYTDGVEADRVLSDFGYGLREAGLPIAGLVQLNRFVRDRTRCDMELEELSSGTVLRLSEDRGNGARGCRLDRSALVEAGARLSAALEDAPIAVIINKFGKVEAEGGGIRDVIATAVERGLPVIVGVPYRNIEQWRAFSGELAEECSVDPERMRRWLSQRLQQDGAAHGVDRRHPTAPTSIQDRRLPATAQRPPSPPSTG